MTIYHGSNLAVQTPRLISPSRTLDFGKGFYTTANIEQAKSFANNVVNRNEGRGIPTISYYEVNFDKMLRELDTLKFDSPSDEWLDFVYANRTAKYSGKQYDIIMGPIANDTLYRVFRLFENGDIDRETVIKRLKIVKLYNQITFASERAVVQLKFIKSETSKNG